MRTFLGALMVLGMVSGDDEVTVNGVLEESVLLPCTCLDINLDEDFKWQMESKKRPVSKYNRTSSYFSDGYKGRAEIFLSNDSSNCSLLLTNITADDQGKYRCRFIDHEKYNSFFVNLNVSARYTFYQYNPVTLDSGVKVFQCDVKGRYPEAEIEWRLDGRLLTDSHVTNVSTTRTLDASTGIYHFNAKLRTEVSWTSEPECAVKAKGVSANVTPEFEYHSDTPHPGDFRMHLEIIPIVLLLGLSLILCYRWRVSQGLIEKKRSGNNCCVN